MAARLYPDPPHLSVSIYAGDQPDAEVFATLCETVEGVGGTPTGEVDVAPLDREFASKLEIAEAVQELELDPEDMRRRVRHGVAGRIISAGYLVPDIGLTVVEYGIRAAGDHFPLEIYCYADDLGTPEELLSPAERGSARRRGRWAHDLLRRATLNTDPLYGEINVEHGLDSPRDLTLDGARTSSLYVADHLLEADPRLESALRGLYAEGAVEEWEGGLYVSAWGFVNVSGRSVPDEKIDELHRDTTSFLIRAVTKAGLRPYA